MLGARTEEYYILFPNSELDEFHNPGLSVGYFDIQGGDEISVTMDRTCLLFYLNKRMELLEPRLGHFFEALYKGYLREGKIKTPYDRDRIQTELRKNIRYWDGNKWVNTPTMNKFWRNRGQTQ